MAKAAVTRWFVGGVTVVIVGTLFMAGAIAAALAGGVVEFGGSDHVSVESGTNAWTILGVVATGLVAITGGVAAVVISWIGALLNTVRLENKTWFGVLLLSGLLGAGPLAMVAYGLAGPDALSPDRQLLSPHSCEPA